MSSFVSIADVWDDVPPESSIAALLAAVPVERSLDWVAHLLKSLFHRANRLRNDAQLAGQWFGHDADSYRALMEHLVAGNALIAAPVLKLFATLALLHGSESPAGDHEDAETVEHYLNRTLPVAMLTTAYYYGDSSYGPAGPRRRGSGITGPEGISELELELAANVLANHSPYPQSMFDRSERRWIEIPAEDPHPHGVNLAEQFRDATGAKLEDLRVIGLALHSRTLGEGPPRVKPEYLDQLNLCADRLTSALRVISLSLADARTQVRRSPPKNLYDTPLLARYPLIRMNDDQMLVLSPDLVAERTYGWLPKWDIQYGPLVRSPAGREAAARAIGYLEHTTEVHARETLQAAATAPIREGVVYGEADIQRAWGTGGKNADAIASWPETAVVAEISSRPPSLGTLSASDPADLTHDLELGVIAKAEQLQGTIDAFRSNPAALLGINGAPERYRPVLITTEGFPVTPLTIPRVRDMLATANLLQGDDVAPLVITTVDALEAVETIGEGGGPDFSQLLAAHEASQMAGYGFREWLLLTYPGTGAPKRVRMRWARVQEPVLAALGHE